MAVTRSDAVSENKALIIVSKKYKGMLQNKGDFTIELSLNFEPLKNDTSVQATITHESTAEPNGSKNAKSGGNMFNSRCGIGSGKCVWWCV